jgi:hypothetical protein
MHLISTIPVPANFRGGVSLYLIHLNASEKSIYFLRNPSLSEISRRYFHQTFNRAS